MPTQTKENYLKAIYFLHQKKEEITITALGEIMEVSKPTVNNMIHKLSANGWIKYEKYKPINLTKKGILDAALIVRKHRLTEMFLVKIMGFGWEEVHHIAEEMEHLKTEELFDRMDEILGYPTADPHGSPIPNKQGLTTKAKLKTLSSLSKGESGILRAVDDSSVQLLKMLNEKNITLGISFHVLKKEEFDNTMYVQYNSDENQTLSYEVCKRLMVEKV